MRSKPTNLPNSTYRLESYFYDLPIERIAQYPLPKRDDAKLMVIDRQRGTITHDIFAHIGKYLPTHAAVVINNSKVIPARLLGRKSRTGGEVEVFLLKALDDGYTFEALLKPLKKIQENEVLDFGHGIEAMLVDREKRLVRFNKKNIFEHLEGVGHIPLPPYIKREDKASDQEDYQTVYAKHLGSVASPTAGLHFTDKLINELKNDGRMFLELTLHINYGTFKPVECDDIRQHPMHTEHYTLEASAFRSIMDAKKDGAPVIAVGTTSARVLESVARTKTLEGSTDIFIYPGYDFKLVDILITNFHLPHSTLLMLVCAFGGYELVMKAYKEAIKEQYRFYSYGDAMLIL